MTLTEACDTYASENAAPGSRAHVAIRRAYMAGALEAARMKPHDVILECLDFARDIGREVIAAGPALAGQAVGGVVGAQIGSIA